MKIDLSKVDTENFTVTHGDIGGTKCVLIHTSGVGAKWDKNTLHFRSSIWTLDGELVSASFPKFFNWGEQLELSPPPKILKDATIVTKVDGSTLIVSKYNNSLILRTRNTFDGHQHVNGYELGVFKSEIINKFLQDNPQSTWDFSLIFEWYSPENKIILNYGDQPKWWLIGKINHEKYTLSTQSALDNLAKIYNWDRTERHYFNDTQELLTHIGECQDIEGCCVYTNNGQTIHKVKSALYLAKHAFKSQATIENVLDIYISLNQPTYNEFSVYLISQFDYECFEMVRGYASNICDAKKQVDAIVRGFYKTIENIKELPTRKEQALKITKSYGKTNRSSFVFVLLEGKTLSKDNYKKLYYQVLKK